MIACNAPRVAVYDDNGNSFTVPSMNELSECCRAFKAVGVGTMIDSTSESDVSLAREALENFFTACKWLSESQSREPIANEQVMFLRARCALRCLFTDAARYPTTDRSIMEAFEHFAMVAIMIAETAHTKLLRYASATASETE
jgi:hypothetical protein